MVRLYEAFKAGDWTGALELHYELSPLFRALFIETNPIPVKTAVGLRGMAAGPVRLPLAELDAEKIEVLAGVLGRSD
jgi:4-hydroxy-tetrahydrodipicolinate synthase